MKSAAVPETMQPFTCPHCSTFAQGPPGTVVKCPQCGQSLQIPACAAVTKMEDRSAGPVPTGAGFGRGDVFGDRPQVLIQQTFEPLELCGCEVRNKYRVGIPGPDDRIVPGSEFMFMQEESECCERICCSVNRELTLNLRQGPLPSGLQLQRQQPLVMAMHKPFHCQGCCCLRPTFDSITDAFGQPVGTVEDPCICCKIDQKLFAAGSTTPTLNAGPVTCCQLGLCCPCCDPVDFPISKQGAHVATVTRPQMDCCECAGMFNRLKVDFGTVADPKERMLIFASAMLLDLEYFEQNKNN
eukprot:TRINITY_DN2040_c0_g1_i1.p1 TRINITY_DN2040_c0_g1~~TRINITY_DN2040_c0_g1_i1.p1  ORF type:complete len:323 (+),score=87.58 TRINITY_DN2040_c0_g1_i1:78-971(+)